MQEDAKQTTKELARKLHIAQSTCLERVRPRPADPAQGDRRRSSPTSAAP
ncbi:Lrp/AsnC family transcriptional regulator [Amycolatopsis sp. NBRC 101858]|nr:Lrp/AsnC family transcriptional regulator [Amycolatopsis sp. NBRC 101858]